MVLYYCSHPSNSLFVSCAVVKSRRWPLRCFAVRAEADERVNTSDRDPAYERRATMLNRYARMLLLYHCSHFSNSSHSFHSQIVKSRRCCFYPSRRANKRTARGTAGCERDNCNRRKTPAPDRHSASSYSAAAAAIANFVEETPGANNRSTIVCAYVLLLFVCIVLAILFICILISGRSIILLYSCFFLRTAGGDRS